MMTQGISNMLGLTDLEDALREKGLLPPINETDSDDDNIEAEIDPTISAQIAKSDLERERNALLAGKDHADAMDVLHTETLKHARDLMDYGFNIDPPRARGIFEVAVGMFGRAIEAKNSKRDAQLKAMKLALDQRKLDLDEQKARNAMGENQIETKASVIIEDRNEMIRRIREQMNEKP